ncbi:MAG: hypothetical protein KKE30_21675 [Gammaproteobacteria bacterium]|nr:hypothetical protein [Gammaproteobacteria bacterium]MBU1556507.1 hypothetical protein [Gammaproteobacteria bacterium]MBU2072188.1 hypothetical protein [Gammaproteobacteria bacterium]MBU2182050.1 hypothetical protein [Gammaproteobacteria bacterium]MBU2203893.1 hypothetical protein [Gammaproteobacteria bacterium]
MELSHFLPCIILLVFSGLSLGIWKTEDNSQTILMICMGWAAISVLTVVGSIMLFIAGGIIVPVILSILSAGSAYVANKFKNLQRT